MAKTDQPQQQMTVDQAFAALQRRHERMRAALLKMSDELNPTQNTSERIVKDALDALLKADVQR